MPWLRPSGAWVTGSVCLLLLVAANVILAANITSNFCPAPPCEWHYEDSGNWIMVLDVAGADAATARSDCLSRGPGWVRNKYIRTRACVRNERTIRLAPSSPLPPCLHDFQVAVCVCSADGCTGFNETDIHLRLCACTTHAGTRAHAP